MGIHLCAVGAEETVMLECSMQFAVLLKDYIDRVKPLGPRVLVI